MSAATPGAIAVTGASRGIGAAIARELAGRGFRVACLSRKGLGIEEGAVNEALAARLTCHRCDVTDEAAIRRALQSVADEGGGLAGLVNNAGVHQEGPSEAFSAADFQRLMTTNALGTFIACREAYPHLKAAGGGTIVNIGSFYDRLGIRGNAAYCASKAAIGALTRCLAVDWAREGIRVIDVAPGYIATDLNRAYRGDERFENYLRRSIPVGRAGEAAEVARLVGAVFAADIPFLTGETIYLDGGQGIAR